MSASILVNDIIKFSNVDGPGNRLVIFTQGCNIQCIYCHNFETINVCINCGRCVSHCPGKALDMVDKKVIYNKSKCIDCSECIKVCNNSSSPKSMWYTIDELLLIIKKYEVFLRGVTISGGECTLQSSAITRLFTRIKKETNLTCFVDTNGYIDANDKSIKELIEVTDKFMIDIKALKETEKIIGVSESNRNINILKQLLELDKIYEVRTVVTNDFDYFKPILKIVANIVKDYDIPYRIIRMNPKVMKKSQKFLSDLIPSDEDYKRYIDILQRYGVNTQL